MPFIFQLTTQDVIVNKLGQRYKVCNPKIVKRTSNMGYAPKYIIQGQMLDAHGVPGRFWHDVTLRDVVKVEAYDPKMQKTFFVEKGDVLSEVDKCPNNGYQHTTIFLDWGYAFCRKTYEGGTCTLVELGYKLNSYAYRLEAIHKQRDVTPSSYNIYDAYRWAITQHNKEVARS